MDKAVISLMCENIRKQHVDIDKMLRTDSKATISYIHRKKKEAEIELKKTRT